MKLLNAAYVVGMLAVACGGARPYPAGGESQPASLPATRAAMGGPDLDLPKYGVADYETIWSISDGARREKLPGFSEDATGRGWRALSSGDLKTAMRRFNQGWSMSPTNGKALWGMAIVQMERAKQGGASAEVLKRMDEPVSLVEEAMKVSPENGEVLSDAALIYATRGGLKLQFGSRAEKAGAKIDFEKAEKLLRACETKMGEHPQISSTWAALEHSRGNVAAAEKWEKRTFEQSKEMAKTRAASQPVR